MFFSDDKCYQVFKIKKTWHQANVACRAISKGGLVTIQSELEQCENHRSVASHRQTLSHNVVSSTPRHERGSNSQR
jgi:hypothetical protein